MAIKHLPNECKTLKNVVCDPAIFDPDIFDTPLIADFEMRKGIFYFNLLDSGNRIERVPS